MSLDESTTPGRTVTQAGTATCAATYYADLIPAHAFVFRVPATDTRFTIYDPDPNRYRVSTDYTLTLSDPDQIGLHLHHDEIDQLRHCLSIVEHHFAEAAAHARAGATSPPTTIHPQRRASLTCSPPRPGTPRSPTGSSRS